jgi:hypothetical protein
MCVSEENLEACVLRTDPGTQSELRWGKGKRKLSVLGKLDSVGSTKNAIFVHPSVRSN